MHQTLICRVPALFRCCAGPGGAEARETGSYPHDHYAECGGLKREVQRPGRILTGELGREERALQIDTV